jgi:hypothetical protein
MSQERPELANYRNFEQMGPAAGFLEHLNLGPDFDRSVIPSLIGDPERGLPPNPLTILSIGGPATAGKTKAASQVELWVSQFPVDVAYLCLATSGHHARIVERTVDPTHAHGKYTDPEYGNISLGAVKLAERFAQLETVTDRPKALIIEFSGAALFNEEGRVRGSDRLFSTVRELVQRYPDSSFGIFLDQDDEVTAKNVAYREEMMAATPEDVQRILVRYNQGLIRNGQVIEPEEVTLEDAERMLRMHKLTNTTPQGVERNHETVRETRRELGFGDHSDKVWHHLGGDPKQLGFGDDNVFVVRNHWTDDRLYHNVDLLQTDLALREIAQHPDQAKEDIIFDIEDLDLAA